MGRYIDMIDIASREGSLNRSLERALHLILAMEASGQPMTLTELSKASQIAKSTVQRILSVLEKYNFVKKWQGRFHLGIIVLPLAYSFLVGNELTRVALPVLQELAQLSEETASLFVRLDFKRILVQRVDGPYPLRFPLPVGQQLPLHIGIGKVLAAALPKDELQQLLKEVGSYKLATGKVITPKMLLDELEEIRRDGCSISISERAIGSASVSAPVNDPNGMTIAAIAVSGNTDRLNLKKLKHLSIEVRAAADAISKRHGAGSPVI